MSIDADIDLAALAGELYDQAYKAVKRGEFMEHMLALHIISVLDYYGQYGAPLWKVRVLPADGKSEKLDTFDEYLFCQPRKGLGLPKSYLWLHRILTAHTNRKEREAALAALRAEITDFDKKVDNERLAERNAAEPARKPGVQEGVVNNPAGLGGKSGKKADIDKDDNINFIKEPKKKSKGGTNPEYVIARLKRDQATDPKAAEVFKRVEAGEVSPHAAAKAMGWVAPTKTIPISEPRKAIEALMKVWSWDEIHAAIQEVRNDKCQPDV